MQDLRIAPTIAHGLYSYQIGGSERIGADLAIGFRDRGYNVVCFAMYDTDGPIRRELEALGIPCVDLDYTTRPRPQRRLTYPVELLFFLRDRSVTHMVVHHATALIHAGLPSKLAGIRDLLMVEHATHQLKESRWYRLQARAFCRFATNIAVVDPLIGAYFESELHVSPSRIRYIANGVTRRSMTDAQRASLRTSLGLTSTECVVLFVGRLHPVKDIGTLIKATANLSAEIRSKTRVLIAGDGEERLALTRLVAELGLASSVQFLGARQDIKDLLGAADVFAMTSITEGQPMAMIEAMMAGLPCVATAVGGIPALLGTDRGLTVPPQNPVAVATALESLIRTPELRARIGSNASEYARRVHSFDACVDAYLDAVGLPRTAPVVD